MMKLVSVKGSLKRLEPYDGKLSRTVLRGREDSNISPVIRQRYRYTYMDYGGYSSGSSYSVNVESQTKKLQKRKEMEANIPKRALMLEKFFDDNLPHLPHLPSGLWNIIADYEGGVESSVLGDNVTSTASWSWCSIL